MAKEHTNTHRITSECMRCGDYVLGAADGQIMIGVSFAPGGWKPARMACSADKAYFGVDHERMQAMEARHHD